MVLKGRKKPVILLKLNVLEGRIPKFHPKMPLIKNELVNRRSGYRGEQSIDYHLRFLPEKQYFFLHGLRLRNKNGDYFQMDTLVLSPQFINIIDVKNYSGIIRFDEEFKQLIQDFNGSIRGLQDPISQINRHQLQLKDWLQKYNFISAPIEPLIVISNSSTIIETTGNPEYFKQITHSIGLDSKVEAFRSIHKKEIFSKNDLHKLARKLINMHTPPEYDPLTHFQINSSEILKGVHCPSCSSLSMIRLRGRWECPVCKTVSKSAHIEALKDYSLLLGNTITIQQCCTFLNIPSRFIAYKLLNSMNLQHSGGTKSRKYYLPLPEYD